MSDLTKTFTDGQAEMTRLQKEYEELQRQAQAHEDAARLLRSGAMLENKQKRQELASALRHTHAMTLTENALAEAKASREATAKARDDIEAIKAEIAAELAKLKASAAPVVAG